MPRRPPAYGARHRVRGLGKVALVVLAPVLLWSAPAFASPSFPAAVDQALGLTGDAIVEKHIDPPMGCLLCHVVESGGAGTNNAFGHEMLNAGAMQDVTATIAPALATIGESNPRAIDDIRSGTNPNDDPTAAGDTPLPQYGCGSIAGAPNGAASGLAWGAPLVLAAARRRRGR
jgi:hypothetical protein